MKMELIMTGLVLVVAVFLLGSCGPAKPDPAKIQNYKLASGGTMKVTPKPASKVTAKEFKAALSPIVKKK